MEVEDGRVDGKEFFTDQKSELALHRIVESVGNSLEMKITQGCGCCSRGSTEAAADKPTGSCLRILPNCTSFNFLERAGASAQWPNLLRTNVLLVPGSYCRTQICCKD
ncbi:hypothetical protein HZH68_010698 [Vespula germanica]|uniref:Uncharacterized protein n=2 Tax=Vespula TaxID=7451 RepID=A0A834JSK2_VESGE|nr:hypothetical protein HZH68_010698 [Vespula germanica]KAF7417070.1 hypothetical protein H0235_011601 [Vespula pensylvanica]